VSEIFDYGFLILEFRDKTAAYNVGESGRIERD